MATQSEASFNCIWLWEEGMPGAAYWAEIFVYRRLNVTGALDMHGTKIEVNAENMQ